MNENIKEEKEKKEEKVNIKILYSTLTGTTKKFALTLKQKLLDQKLSTFFPQVFEISEYDPNDLQDESSILIFIIATLNGGPPRSAKTFSHFLTDLVNDQRIPQNYLSKLRYWIYGIGDLSYNEKYNKFARDVDVYLRKKGGNSILKKGLGNHGNKFEELLLHFNRFTDILVEKLKAILKPNEKLNENVILHNDKENDKDIDIDIDNEDEDEDDNFENDENDENQTTDIEDVEMLTPIMNKILTKQKYITVGTHSAVKLCRWAKAMLRGKGVCYKHAFYGIISYSCMEMTTSLACANKCIFCWRHNKNPTCTSWHYKQDPPEMIYQGSIKAQKDLIKPWKGVPGVTSDRYKDAFNVRHCALSLVGEPIIYPQFDEFTDILHENRISTFCVTNAQFPEKIESIKPVTQLYLSIDAPTKDILFELDRPLFPDFWERFLKSIENLAKRNERTVFRITVLKQYNDNFIQNYVDLIKLGKPDFVELKGVTYGGFGTNPKVSMNNVPYHQEIVKMAQEFMENDYMKENYGIACEHAHSCGILIAKKIFYKNNSWHTWIDFDKFFQLFQEKKPFTREDYMMKTPDWALFGSKEKGSNPKFIENMEERLKNKVTDIKSNQNQNENENQNEKENENQNEKENEKEKEDKN